MTPDQVAIRLAGPEDAEPVARLISRFLTEEGFSGAADEIGAAAETFLSEPANAAFLAFAADHAAGIATVTTTFGFEAGRYAELEDLYVLPEHRGSGIAASLVEAASDWCRSRGCRIVEVVVTPEGESRHRLVDWYLARGFIDEGRRILWRRL